MQTSKINWSQSKAQVRSSHLGASQTEPAPPRVASTSLVTWSSSTLLNGPRNHSAAPSAIVDAIQATGRDAILRGSGSSDSKSLADFVLHLPYRAASILQSHVRGRAAGARPVCSASLVARAVPLTFDVCVISRRCCQHTRDLSASECC